VTKGGLLYLTSFLAHGALALGVVSIKGARAKEVVAISMVETKKPAKVEEKAPEAPKETPPPETPKAKAASRPKAEAPAPAPPPAAEAPVAAADLPSAPDFGLTLGGGVGGGPGLAVAAGAGRRADAPKQEQVTKKVLAAPAPQKDACTEAIHKAKVLSITQPSYTSEARAAQAAGRVRVEVTVDATGRVASARVLEGLGFGLDEAALAAARAATFEPGTKCGTPTSSTFVIAIRFTL
jgi:protein TonB